jgi:multidrug efflux pump subunit AcrA (membrane-fusion protein)
LCIAVFALRVQSGFAQGNLPMATAGDHVTIKREACRVIDAHKYRVPLSMEAIQTVTLVAPFDATIKQIAAKTNSKVQPQSEIVRLDNTAQKLQFNRAQLALKQAQLEQKAAGKEETIAALSQVKVDIAKIDVEICQSVLDQTSVRAPFAGEVQRLLVAEGQFVRAGDPIAIVADTSKMKVEIPVDRALAEIGKPFSLKVESSEVDGRIDSVLPLPAKFDVLRELFDSIASIVVVADNNDGKIKVGQTVYAAMIPRQPVVEVPTTSIGNLADGHRKVQVLRQSVVRDISVSLLGQVGTSRVFVSGTFAEGDEAIYESSHQLSDGFQLKNSAGLAASTGSTGIERSGAPTNPTPPPKTNAGF